MKNKGASFDAPFVFLAATAIVVAATATVVA